MSWEVNTMKSGTSFFNGAVYRNCLKRYWPVWAGLCFILALDMAVPVLNMGSANSVTSYIRNVGGYGGVATTFIFAAIAAMTVYSYLYNARSTGFIASLPVRREAMFLSCWAAGYTMLAGAGVIAALLTLLACAGKVGADTAVLVWLMQYLLMSLAFFGFASLCALLTGTLWVLPVVYAVLNVAVVAVWYLVCFILETLVFGYSLRIPDLAMDLSPIVKLFTLEWNSSHFMDWTPLCCYALAGAVSSVLALLLCRRRRMESATDVVSVNILKPVFRWCAAIVGALGLGNLLYVILFDNDHAPVFMALFLLIGGFIGWVIAEMLVRKSYKIGSCLKIFPIFAAVAIGFVVVCEYGAFGYVDRIPAAESVRSVMVDGNSYCAELTDAADIESIRRVHSELLDAGRWDGSGDGYRYGYLTLSYALKNGTTVIREYNAAVLTEDAWKTLDEIAAHAEIRSLREHLKQSDDWVDAVYFWGDGWHVDLSERDGWTLVNSYLLPALESGQLQGRHFGYEATLDHGIGYAVEDETYIEPIWFELNINFREMQENGYYRHENFYYNVTEAQPELCAELKRLLEQDADYQAELKARAEAEQWADIGGW